MFGIGMKEVLIIIGVLLLLFIITTAVKAAKGKKE
jgi:competence protein ComGC